MMTCLKQQQELRLDPYPNHNEKYKVGFAKETNKPTIMRAEQEVGNIPFNTEVTP